MAEHDPSLEQSAGGDADNATTAPSTNLPLRAGGGVEAPQRRLGTFEGVFLPTLLTILGAVMYLRVGWTVGNAGLLGGLVVITMTYVITICTGLSVSSLATNVRVGSGGAFSIISQSLGLEVGGSVSVPFYAALSISVAFYLFAFSEGWARLFPHHPVGVVVGVCLVVCFIIAMASVTLATRARYLILVLVAASIVSILLGAYTQLGQTGALEQPEMWGDFGDGGFWAVFAVFFPAATGLLTGVNLSGTLAAPRRSIALGTMSAILLSLAVYIAIAVWASLVATPQELNSNLTITVDRAAFEWVVMAGLLAATFSAALNSMVGAPRILQAVGEHGVVPGGEYLARHSRSGIPRIATLVTGLIALATVVFGFVFGGLNAIAPLMTMFFLIIYSALNGVVLLEQSLGLISFRPTLRLPRIVPLIGFIGSFLAMFLINPSFGLVAVVVTLLFHGYLMRQNLRAPWGDVRSGLFVSVAEWAAKRAANMPTSQERAWRPNLIVPLRTNEGLETTFRFLRAFVYPRGSLRIMGFTPPRAGDPLQGVDDSDGVDGTDAIHGTDAIDAIDGFISDLRADDVYARRTRLQADDFIEGVRIGLDVIQGSFFRPTVLFLPLDNESTEEDLNAIATWAAENHMGATLLALHPDAGLAIERTINVWVSDQSPEWEVGLRLSNLDLALLLAYQLSRNWGAEITLICVVSDEASRTGGEEHLRELIDLGRMPRGTRSIVEVGAFEDVLATAPRADVNILGLPHKIDLTFVRRTVEATGASCVFVRDSGDESALA